MLQWIGSIDQHPPLYYLLLHLWSALHGDSPYAVRLLSALFGAATIPIIYLIGKRLSGAVVGVVAAVLLAFSPFHIYFAQEARMYTLLAFNAAVAIYALARLLTDPRATLPIGRQLREYVHTWRTAGPVARASQDDLRYQVAAARKGWRAWIFRHRWSSIKTIETDLAWIALIVFSAATLLTHNTAVFFFAATNLFVLGLFLMQRQRNARVPPALLAPSPANWVKAQLAVLLLWAPWAVIFVRQAGRVYQEFWIPQPTPESVAQSLRSVLGAGAPGPAGLAILWLLCGLLLLSLLYFRQKLSLFLFLATLFAVPILCELIVSIIRPIFLPRTLIWITVPLFLLLAAGVVQLRFRFLMVLVVGVVATYYMFAAGDYYRYYQKEDWSTAAGYVANFAEKDDLVLFNSNFVEIPFNYYFEPFAQKYRLEVVQQGVPLDLLDSGILEPKMTESDIPRLKALVREYDRVWLVYSHDSYTDPVGLIPQTLASVKHLSRTREFYGGEVQLYETP
jgi:4-amino-4-deoxy-L-arabinose transferase-like glycosyltransferase